MGERQFGPYRLVRQIAVGGMAEIHLAKTKGIAGFEKYVALKMIHPNFAEDEQFIQMLVDEAKIAVQLNHGNIAQTFDLGRVGETFYITMEYVDGADLYKILRRGSESDHEMPLDVCAFVAKEVASALDHAHRKRDHTGKSLGIVHRDVSPQNVLISYAGEIKLVDFGIAKATMKARQTAVGVIKGKYYYMSPEQAWGDPIDYRSDIFSAGIVLYEMITGQMLYLEEDLHRLLDMARRADIKSPSTLRKGIPPQLERIVMHALAKVPGERYQSAGDFATDLERFLHAYSPVFTATKVAAMIKKIVGEPIEVPDDPEIEVRDGPIATHTLNDADLIHSSDELDHENSVIFRVADLKPKQPEPKPPRQPTLPMPAGPRITRQADIKDIAPPPVPASRASGGVAKLPTPAAGMRQPTARAPSKPRLADEQTREVPPAPPSGDESGLLPVKPPSPLGVAKMPQPSSWSDRDDTHDHDDLANIGERTLVTGGPKGFMMDVASEEGVDATIVSAGPPQLDDSDDLMDDGETLTAAERPSSSDEDGPTVQRDFSRPRVTAARGSAVPPAALAAKIDAPAVSELRKPRASRKTPGAGVPQGNVLQALVNAQTNEPMPVPMPPRAPPANQPYPQQPQYPQQQQPPYNGQPYATDASGLPLAVTTPPPGTPVQMVPNVPAHLQPYAMQPGYQQPQQYPYPAYAPQNYPQQTVTPGALYQYGAPPQQMSLTGQLRLFEADEMPSQYRVSGGGAKWLKLVIAGVIAISVAAGVTFFIIKSTREQAPTTGAVHIESVPPGAEVFFDGTRLAGTTPMTIDNTPVGTRHEIRVQLARHQVYTEMVDIPKQGGEVPVSAVMKPITGKLKINTIPPGADVMLDGQLRGRTPTTVNDIDMAEAKRLELRLKDYQPYIQQLTWPANGEIDIDTKLSR